MLPAASDVDSNFEYEVDCTDGRFIRPIWPLACEEERVCLSTNLPSPPADAAIRLLRADTRAKFRVGEKAYFYCADEQAVLDDDSGSNVYELACEEGSPVPAFNPAWPTCVLEPVCSDLPQPPASAEMRVAGGVDSVKVGAEVVYECVRRDEFFETPDVSF